MLVSVYVAYLVICGGLTLWVGNVLQENGKVFLFEHFNGSEERADSFNKLLIVGFYLFSFGFIALSLKYGARPATLDQGIEFLSTRVGFSAIVLGFIHCMSLIMRIIMKP